MSVHSGNEVQEQVGKILASVRVDKLQLRNSDLSEALTAHAGKRITHSRISEAEHGRANLNQEYVTLFMSYLRDEAPDVRRELELDGTFLNLIGQLPDFGISNHSNAGQEGNTSHLPKSPPIARMLQQRKERKLQAQAEPSFSVTFEGGAMILTTPDFRITVEQA